jgi:SAM-dependent methyltransferase
MQMDVTGLRDFYDTPLGVTVRRLLRQRIRDRWTRVHGEVVIGLGFAIPYLSAFRGEAAVLGAFMPAAQGVMAWPRPGPRLTVLVEEGALPLPDSSVDRMLMVHSLEMSEQVRTMLREVWRVLKPEGHLLMVVPNRRGAWARFDTTPFGHGRPYSRGQLEALLVETMLGPVGWSTALSMPPLDWRVARRYADTLERTGARYWPAFAGVNLVEARKDLVAPVAVSRRLAGVRHLRPFRASPAMPAAARAGETVATDQAAVRSPLTDLADQPATIVGPTTAASAETPPACRRGS